MWDCLAQSTHKQRLAADRIAHIKGAQTESLEHHNLLQGAQGIRLRVINEAQHPVAQKLTRPDGEIMARALNHWALFNEKPRAMPVFCLATFRRLPLQSGSRL
jgi:hypothetical protein